ncbi:hypothetical protein [Catenulispora sp. GAS73]|uniref:hypothetical protein n=1 Tax=Catenulispora sp. GAS73 TaxID=3156269 RepID=UPI003511D3AA
MSVREDCIREHIPALAVALGISSHAAADDHIAHVRTLQEAWATLIYDHNDKTVTANSDDGPIQIKIHR